MEEFQAAVVSTRVYGFLYAEMAIVEKTRFVKYSKRQNRTFTLSVYVADDRRNIFRLPRQLFVSANCTSDGIVINCVKMPI